jgi:transcriptional regulator, XRE family
LYSIGSRISYVRQKRRLTQAKLAELADISIQHLSAIENDKKNMTVAILQKIADALNITTDYIIYGRETLNENFLINTMINTLSEKNKKNAEKLIEIFVDAVNDNSNSF